MKCNSGLKDGNLECLRCIAEATDQGRRCVLASGDCNMTAAELEASGILDGLGLEIVVPASSAYTGTAGEEGSPIDHLLITKGCRSLIASCEVVWVVPCGLHLGVRTTLSAAPRTRLV